MVLNNHSFLHAKIVKLCSQIELLADMKLTTDLFSDFEKIRFNSKFGYIVIDYKNDTCFALGHHISDVETRIIDDIMVYLNWLEVGKKWLVIKM